MDRMDSVARRLDRSLTRDVVFAIAGPIALGTALGMLVVSWSSYGGAVAARAPHLSIERAPVTDVCDGDGDDADGDDADDLAEAAADRAEAIAERLADEADRLADEAADRAADCDDALSDDEDHDET